ncbi:hypothetical protein FB451DRAFT_1560096 [Mycena latifolia]|nr:hypothetical protein FB451DRAFT_1560096 [Mycena latifolia]
MASREDTFTGSPLLSCTPDASALRAELAQIDAEMAELQVDTRLIQLAEARGTVEAALESVVYPILTLPPEITGEIFLQYLEGLHIDDDRPRLVDIHARAGPLLLAQICRAWRSIAVGLPSMWSRPRLYSTKTRTQNLLQCWLARAGRHPLDLDIIASFSSNHTTERLFPTISPYSTQWRTFSCHLQFPILFLINEIQGRIPLLRELTISGPENGHDRLATVTAFSNAPQLRRVELLHMPSGLISLPWGQLTHLECFAQDIAQCVDILHHTPRLETLSVDLDALPRGAPAPVRLDHLRKLIVRDSFRKTLNLLGYLASPALTELDVLIPDDGAPLERLIAFLTRSTFKLRYIPLDCSYPFIIPALTAVGTVSEVSIPTINSTKDLADIFDIATDRTFLPRLRSLSFEQCWKPIPYAEMCDMLEARWCGRGTESYSSKLDSFRLLRRQGDPDCPPTPLLSARLRVLEDDGLKIHIAYLNWF